MKLNKTERLKEALSPYDFRAHIEKIDLENLSEADRFYLKNYGIYNIKLRPERFMLRLRIAGGRVALTKMERLLEIVDRYALEVLLTARAQMELHGLHAANVLEVWRAVQAAGFTTLQTLTDNFRNIVTDPYDGVAADSMLEVYPLVERMQALFLDRPEWMGMIPRKCNTAITATLSPGMHFFGNDIFFAPARRGEIFGFNLYLGGKNSHSAQSADIFVPPEDVVAMFEAVARAYYDYGLRGSRSKTRLFHLIEAVGMAQVRAYIGGYFPKSLQSAGTLQLQKYHLNDFEKLQEDSYGARIQSRYGKIDIKRLVEVVAFARSEWLQMRLGVDQNLYLIGLKEAKLPFESVSHAEITACAGSHFCALSLWDVKDETRYLPQDLLKKHAISVGFSGCLKGCGRHHHADIGLVGLRTNLFGPVIKAARVFLGSEYSQQQLPARLIFHVVPLDRLGELIEAVVSEFVASGEKDFEDFSRNHLNRYSTGFLMLWFLSKCHFSHEIRFGGKDEATLYAMLREMEGFPKVEEKPGSYEEAVRILMHALWDVAQA